MNEARRLGRNFGTIASAQLFTQILTLVVSLVVARSLGVEQYGIFVFGLAFPSWFLLFALLGLDAVLTIDVAADRSKAGSYLTAVALLRIPLVLIATLSLWIFVQLVLSDPFARTVTMILGVSSLLATYAGTFRSVFRAFERMEFGALVTVIERSVTTAGVVILVLLGYGLLEVAWVFLLGSVVNLILLVFITRRRFVWFERQVDLSTAGRILRKAVPFALAAVVGTLLYSSGPVLLTIMQDPIGTGQFNAAFALTLAVHSPLTIYATVALPMLSRVHRDRPEFLPSAIQRAQRLFFIVGMPISLGGWFYANEIMVLFYGEAFQVSARSFEVLIFAVAISTAAVGTGPALAATNHQKLHLGIGAIATSTHVSLLVGFIPLWGPVGAAYAFVAARFLGAGLSMTALHRLVARIDLRETLVRPALASLGMILVLYLLPNLPLWLGILGGSSLYFLVLFAAKGVTREDLALVRDAWRGAFFR